MDVGFGGLGLKVRSGWKKRGRQDFRWEGNPVYMYFPK